MIDGIQDMRFSQQCYKDLCLLGCYSVLLATSSEHFAGTTVLHSSRNNYTPNITTSHPRRIESSSSIEWQSLGANNL
jgi:hypothetical protein